MKKGGPGARPLAGPGAEPQPSLSKPPKKPPDYEVLDRLHALVSARRDADPRRSHSARLLARGTRKVAQKLGEETFECLIEAVAGDRKRLTGEAADVLYHLVVLWVDQGVRPEQVWAELRRREGTSGIDEKASRPPHPPQASKERTDGSQRPG